MRHSIRAQRGRARSALFSRVLIKVFKEWSCIAAIVIIFILFQNSCASHRCVFGLIGLSCREHSHRTGDYFLSNVIL